MSDESVGKDGRYTTLDVDGSDCVVFDCCLTLLLPLGPQDSSSSSSFRPGRGLPGRILYRRLLLFHSWLLAYSLDRQKAYRRLVWVWGLGVAKTTLH